MPNPSNSGHLDIRSWHICVVIPARDEEKLLPRCLNSVLRATERVCEPDTADIVVVSDLCTDRTYQIASAILGRHGIVLSCQHGNVGAARRRGVKIALKRHQGPLTRCWIANTDADCVVPSDWLSNQLTLAREGTEAVAGTVRIDHFLEHRPEVRERLRKSVVIDRDGPYPHACGANMGLAAETYVSAGGWSPLCIGEDHDLWKRVLATGARAIATEKIQVITSGRQGRTPDGFMQRLPTPNEDAA
jgi:glycosyltransferase involved in cell wall biosynthesis